MPLHASMVLIICMSYAVAAVCSFTQDMIIAAAPVEYACKHKHTVCICYDVLGHTHSCGITFGQLSMNS